MPHALHLYIEQKNTKHTIKIATFHTQKNNNNSTFASRPTGVVFGCHFVAKIIQIFSNLSNIICLICFYLLDFSP